MDLLTLAGLGLSAFSMAALGFIAGLCAGVEKERSHWKEQLAADARRSRKP